MLRRSAILFTALLFLANAVPVGAQMQPGPSQPTLWGHGEVPEGEDERIFMNANKGDPRATDTANGPGYCPSPFDQGVPVAGEPGCDAAGQAGAVQRPTGDFDHTFTLAMDPALSADVPLDPDGVIAFTVYLGASSGSCEGEFVTRLSTGETVVAETEAVAFSFDAGYVGFDAEAPVQAEVLGSGEELVWTIEVTCSGSGLFLGVHDDTGKSFLTLPVTGTGASDAPTQAQNLTGDDVSIDLAASQASNVTHRFTWLNATDNATLDYVVNVTTGSALLRVLGGNGTMLFEMDFTTNSTGNETILDGPDGPWTIEVEFSGFVGMFHAALGLAADGTPGDAEDPAGEGQGDDDEADEDDGFLGTPGPGLLAALVVVAGAAFAARRR